MLELGARFGTTSCAIARAQNNSGRLVSVEPDGGVHAMLLGNRRAHRCNFHVLRGTVGDVRLAHAAGTPLGYATIYRPAAAASGPEEPVGDRPGRGGGLRGGAASAQPPPAAAVPHFRYEELERRIGAKFDTVLVDCEGCIETALGGANAGLLSQIELLLIEEDVPQQTDYAAWHARLRAA